MVAQAVKGQSDICMYKFSFDNGLLAGLQDTPHITDHPAQHTEELTSITHSLRLNLTSMTRTNPYILHTCLVCVDCMHVKYVSSENV